MAESSTRQSGILSLAIKDKSALYAAYMPFVVHGGLFIPTNRDYDMGQEVFMLLNLMEETERLPIAGKIIWKTPVGSGSYRACGVGVQFSDQDGGLARNKIETYLAGALAADRSTHTM
ncbi:PilZ domain-containing protein [Crenothrix polyspora]|jgi:type IV pilus assembly protein PilZ|uniref:Type 4 fimbrial biogenesis protein PilZ n=1 Tax=Crenothrix polyspora TaxID=360316 RepID=A0A1R4H2Y0_9GAMM|nr:PilZ domain-containing protein [Crenothrix polyspora]SJM90608.1 Type 4 fimbrial biogenesis protein PilZ [Crenothrix polyspora]